MNALREMIGAWRFVPQFQAIVITGGPCGGKSTFLRMAITMLQKHGIKVIVVPEVAREIIAAGLHPLDPLWKGADSFQENLFKMMVAKEYGYFEAIKDINSDCPIVFLCDRGLLDGTAYMGESAFSGVLSKFGIPYAEVLDRYSAVIALVSAANGADAHYMQDDQRGESLEEARLLDTRTIAAWHGHQHLSIIDNSTDFPTKINRALIALRRTLAMPTAQEIEKKFLVRNFDISRLPADTKSFEITQVYITDRHRPGVECRVRRKTLDRNSSYYYNEKTDTKLEGVRGESESQIGEARYEEFVRLFKDPACQPVEKTRYKFRFESHIVELDVYHGRLTGLVTAEVEFKTVQEMADFVPPDFLSLVDVTADKRYSNRQLAQHGIPK